MKKFKDGGKKVPAWLERDSKGKTQEKGCKLTYKKGS
jgi:hypothetical protein